jgi:protein translocase SecG subunit
MMTVYLPACLGLISIVLLQKGRGTSFAGAFGIGPGSETIFGPRASKSVPVRLTHILAGLFMVLAITMSLVSGRLGKGIAPEKVLEDKTAATESAVSGLDDLGIGQDSEPATPEEPRTAPKPAAPVQESPETPASEAVETHPTPTIPQPIPGETEPTPAAGAS